MRDKLSQLHKSFVSIGLDDAAKRIQAIDSLYVKSSDDFSTEIKILLQIADILDELKDLKFHDTYASDKSLPGYSISTHNERIVKDAESLQGYTKKEILAGINNYLHSFIKNFMEVKFDRVGFENEDKYGQAINTISDALRELQAASKSVSKGSVSKLLFKVLRSVQDIDLFTRIIKREIPKLKDERWTGPIAKTLPAKALLGPDIKGGTWAEILSNIKFDLDSEMRKIDEEYMASHDIDPSDFYYMIKSFRSHVSDTYEKNAFTTVFVKTAEDDDIIDLSDEDNIGNKKKPEPPKAKPSLDKFDFIKKPGLLSYNPTALEEPTNLRSIVTQIATSGSLFSKDKSSSGVVALSPVLVYRAYYQFLLPLFKEQYTSLINTAHQIHTSLYQVQAVQNKLAKSLRTAAKELGA